MPALHPSQLPTTLRVQEWWADVGLDLEGHPFLIATIDVQQDWFRLLIRAWNRRSQSRLAFVETVTTAGRLKDICGSLGVRPERTLLDRRHKPDFVRMICAQFGWRSLQGETDKDYLHPDGIRRVMSPDEYIQAFQGTIHQGQAVLLENKFAKWTCLDRLDLLRRLPGPDGRPLFSAADDAPDWYFKELDAYTRIPKFKKRTKEEISSNVLPTEFHEWQAHGPDHSADCEIMNIAAASMLNLTGAESLASTQTPPTPPPNN